MSILFRRCQSTERTSPTRASHRPTPPETRPTVCGWFDSSHELHRGLQVTEHDGLDAVAGDLPLSDWLRMQLSGWRAVEARQA